MIPPPTPPTPSPPTPHHTSVLYGSTKRQIQIKIEKLWIRYTYNKYVQNGKFESEFLLLEIIIIELNELFKSIKALQYEILSKKLNNILLQSKNFLVHTKNIL